MSRLDEEKVDELKKIFNEFDKDNNGRIDWDEFCCMLDEILTGKTLEQKTEIFNLVDTNHNGAISFHEFCNWWNKQEDD